MGPEQVWGVGSGLGVSVGDCFRKDRGDIGVVKKAGGRGTEKKTQPHTGMLFPTAVGQAPVAELCFY